MNTFKKTVIAVATIATIAVAAAAPAQAGSKHWKHGIGAGIGLGVGLAIAGAILNNQPRTVYVQQPTYVVQPTCYYQQRQFVDAYGVIRIKNVQVCN